MTRHVLIALLLASTFGHVTSWPETAYALFAVSLLTAAIVSVIKVEAKANRESELRVIGRDLPILRREVDVPAVLRRGQR